MITNWLYDILLDYDLYIIAFILGFATIILDFIFLPIEIPIIIIRVIFDKLIKK